MRVRPMEAGDLDRVMALESECFESPWSRESLEKDLYGNIFARYRVLVEKEEILGYYGIWHVFDEGHLLNIAIAPDHRGKGYARLLMENLLAEAREEGVLNITLEVRTTNSAARSLYEKYDFKVEGRLKNYYRHPTEDALIMWRRGGALDHERQYSARY